MPHTFASLLVHVVFSTKNRAPDLPAELTGRVFPHMGGIVKELKGTALIVNGPADHVHLLLSMPAAISVADLLRVLKTNSCRWVHEQFPARKHFGWQAGYGAFTASGSQLEDVKSYIASQQTHHQRVTFQEEFLALLRRRGLMCVADEVWG
jgi:REP element-mobilizing transposase RayT